MSEPRIVREVAQGRSKTMTLDEVAALLPNGFHDSEIRSIGVSYVRGVATIDWTIDLTSPDEPNKEPATAHTKVIIRGLKYLVIEAPDTDATLAIDESISVVDSYNSLNCDGSGKKLIGPTLLNAASQARFANSFFVNDWNSFIHVAADEAELIWAREDAKAI